VHCIFKYTFLLLFPNDYLTFLYVIHTFVTQFGWATHMATGMSPNVKHTTLSTGMILRVNIMKERNKALY